MITRRELLSGAVATGAMLAARPATAATTTSPAALFVSHGSPLYLPIPGNDQRRRELAAWGARVAPPAGVVVMTPHFAARRLELGPTSRGFAWYDLPGNIARGLPQNLEYPTPASDALGAHLRAVLGQELPQPARRGFDHTTWMPLRCLFPAAHVPVVELGYPYVPEADAFALGRKLAPLRTEGVLFVGSGGMTHNLALDLPPGAPSPAFSIDFDAWATDRLTAGDVDGLIDWRAKAPAAYLAHPDDGGHYRVMLVALGFALGSGGAPSATFPIAGFEDGLSKRCVEFGYAGT